MKKLIIFDLDGTLAESKSAIDLETAGLLERLLGILRIAVISGGDWPQFERQLLAKLGLQVCLQRLSLLPTCGTKFYRYCKAWERVYSDDFSADQKDLIIRAVKEAAAQCRWPPQPVWGEIIEDRGSQITFSALGQQAPLEQKKAWDPDFSKRGAMKHLLEISLPEFSIRLGGTTSVDITKPGIDKAYGIRRLRDLLQVSLDEMIFIGDALFPGGNDFPAKEAGVVSIQVRDPNETKRVMETILACLEA